MDLCWQRVDFQAPLIEEAVFSPLYILASFVKDKVAIGAWIYLCKLWKILKEMGTPDHLTCLLRNLYAGQEATVKTVHGTIVWFQIRKGICQECILSPCLFNLYAEYIKRNAGLEEAQAGIKIAGRNSNHLRYADDTTLWQKVKRN